MHGHSHTAATRPKPNTGTLATAMTAMGPAAATNEQALRPTTRYFSKVMTNTTSELPVAVIKELKGGFKNYIPLLLCTHKACSNATRSTDAFDTEIGMNDKGEIRLKQKTMMAAKDHYLSTDDFTEIRENFTRGMQKHLILGNDVELCAPRALDCMDMFREFFSIIAARPDYMQDWPAYRGYIIESYTSWVGRRDDSFGLIFNEQLFYKYKMKNLLPTVLEQLRQPALGPSSFPSFRSNNFGGNSFSGARGRGCGSQSWGTSNPNRGGYQPANFPSSFRPYQAQTTFRCYLCGEPHSHRDHQGNAKRLITNEQGKWIDRLLGNKVMCIAFNIGSSGCRRGPACTYSHSCSFCGDLSHGSARCAA
jgi:hypothetical protein